jgi:hypothetical protein
MRSPTKVIASVALAFAGFSANAAMVSGSVGNIVHLYSYATSGNGEAVVVVSSTLPGCADGFWLRSSDPGFKNVFAQIMSARLTQTPIRVWAYNDQLWPSSTGQFCRIDAVDLDL